MGIQATKKSVVAWMRILYPRPEGENVVLYVKLYKTPVLTAKDMINMHIRVLTTNFRDDIIFCDYAQ